MRVKGNISADSGVYTTISPDLIIWCLRSFMATGEQGIGLLGCGAIGRGLAAAVDRGKVPGAALVAVFDQDGDAARALAGSLACAPSTPASFDEMLADERVDIVVEAASQNALRTYGEAVLSRGKDLLAMSTGALLDGGFLSRLSDLSAETSRRVYAPSGAVGGIDAIRASREELEEVTLTTRKHPDTLVDVTAPRDAPAEAITSATVVFEGNALEAVRRFPFNINVASVLSLAGIGPERTRVRIIADPDATGNNHEIYARGRSGALRFTMENVPHPDNPMTSYLALLSAIETLRRACQGGVKIGA